MRRRKRQKKSKKIFFLIFFFAIIAVLLFFMASAMYKHLQKEPLFEVAKVECNGIEDKALKKEIEEKVLHRSLLSLDLNKLHRRLLDTHLEIKELTLVKHFPDKIEVRITKRIPYFQIKTNHYYIVDKDFKVIRETLSPYPELVIVDVDAMRRSIRQGSSVDDIRIKKAAQLIDLSGKFPHILPTIILADSLESFSFMVSETKVILGKGDLEKKLIVLDSLVKNKFNNDLSSVRYIDLRYSKVYIGKKR